MRTLPTEPPSSSTLDLCCGGKKCPTLTDEGDTIVIADAEQSTAAIRFDKHTDGPKILVWLQDRLTR